jgi:peptide/nickel transport system substrate-binding protein
MDNRFGFKDLVNALLLVAVMVVVVLAMVQYDRQWQTLRRLTEQMDQLTREQARLGRDIGTALTQLETRAALPPSTPTPAQTRDAAADTVAWAQDLPDPFARLRAAQAQADYAQGDSFVNSFNAKVARITPLISTDAYAADIQERVLQTLAVRDPDTLKWMPMLAQTWWISDDGLTIRFKLRPGLTFSDGEPLTAADVQFTFELIMNEAIDAPRTRNFIRDKLGSVKAVSADEVVYQFKEPYFQSFGLAAGLEVLPRHFYERFTPAQINALPGLLLGSGPYRMPTATDWAPGQPLMLVRNERYWGAAPAFARMIYQEINNEVARLTAFRNGELDIFGAMPEQYVQIKDDPDLNAKANFFEFERPISGYGFVAWNQRRHGRPTPFADQRVRQAMAYLYDRERMNRDILMGFGIFPTGPFNRLSPQYNHQVKPYAYDVEQAKALLAAAGYTDRDGDGVVESSDGKPLRFKITFGSGGNFWPKVWLMFKDAAARAGVVVDLDPLEWAVFDEKLKSRDFDALAMAWGGGIEGDIHQMFHSSNIQDGDNFMSYSNPQLDALIDEARRTVDEARRMELWQQCHALLHEDQPYLFLYSRKSLVYVDRRIQNVQQTRLGLSSETEWYVPQAQQKYRQ